MSFWGWQAGVQLAGDWGGGATSKLGLQQRLSPYRTVPATKTYKIGATCQEN